MTEEALPFCNKFYPADGPKVKVANGGTIAPSLQTTCGLAPELTPKAQCAFIFDSLKTGSLVSIGHLCDDDCIALFTKYDLKVIKNNKVLIIETRNNNGLWDILLEKSSKPSTLQTPTIKKTPSSTNL